MLNMVDEILLNEDLSQFAKEQILDAQESSHDESNTIIQTLTIINGLKIILFIAIGITVCK